MKFYENKKNSCVDFRIGDGVAFDLCFIPRLVDGKKPTLFASNFEGYPDAWMDSDGYFVNTIYPHMVDIFYRDENYIFHEAYHMGSFTQEEYRYRLTNEIMPLCDELLEKGYISQDQYDIYTMADPVDIVIKRWID